MTEIETKYARKISPRQYESTEAALSIRETTDPLKTIESEVGRAFSRNQRLVEDFLSGKMSEDGFVSAGGTVERKSVSTGESWPENVNCGKCGKVLKGHPDKFVKGNMRYWCGTCRQVTLPNRGDK